MDSLKAESSSTERSHLSAQIVLVLVGLVASGKVKPVLLIVNLTSILQWLHMQHYNTCIVLYNELSFRVAPFF
jgi:hypothetical protein